MSFLFIYQDTVIPCEGAQSHSRCLLWCSSADEALSDLHSQIVGLEAFNKH